MYINICDRVPSFREAKFCGVASCVFDKLGCAAGKNVCGTLLQGTRILSSK
jgi:hypothetical protein